MIDCIDTYCPECDSEVHARLHCQQASLSVRGENVAYTEVVATCPVCGTTIGDTQIEGENLERAYVEYRSRHGIMSPDEIRDLRASYELSLREFSKFLGFGEQTVYRYERGDLPDQTHGNTLRSALSVNGARLLLSQNRTKLSAKSIIKIEQQIRAMEANIAKETTPLLVLEEREASVPSATNGYRRLSLERVFALVFILAEKCQELYWTKLQKAAFFADLVYFERNSQSLTGLTYAHAPRGPIIDRKEEIRFILAARGIVDFREHGYGEILVPLAYDTIPFSTSELVFIDEIADFVNTFASTTDLSEYSHNLSCWANSVNGETIEYTSSHGEVAQAVRKRMESTRHS